MANYFDDLETSIAAVIAAYVELQTVLADDAAALEDLRRSIFTDLLPIASGINNIDFCAVIRNLSGSGVAAVQAGQDEGVGDYTP